MLESLYPFFIAIGTLGLIVVIVWDKYIESKVAHTALNITIEVPKYNGHTLSPEAVCYMQTDGEVAWLNLIGIIDNCQKGNVVITAHTNNTFTIAPTTSISNNPFLQDIFKAETTLIIPPKVKNYPLFYKSHVKLVDIEQELTKLNIFKLPPAYFENTLLLGIISIFFLLIIGLFGILQKPTTWDYPAALVGYFMLSTLLSLAFIYIFKLKRNNFNEHGVYIKRQVHSFFTTLQKEGIATDKTNLLLPYVVGIGFTQDFLYIYEHLFQTPQPWLIVDNKSYPTQLEAFVAFLHSYTTSAINNQRK